MRNITSRLRKINDMTSSTKNLLDSIEYDEHDFIYLSGLIRKYHNNNYPMGIIVSNWKQIRDLGNDSSSLESCIIRYGDEVGRTIFEQKCKNTTRTKEDYIEKYGAVTAQEILSSRGASLDNYIKRHGEALGRTKWETYCNKRLKTFETGRKEKRYASRNLEWFQNKHGKEKGYAIWDKKKTDQAYKVSREYYIEQYGVDEGTKRCSESKTRSLDNFIKKYGFTEGTKRYNSWLMNVVSAFKNRRNYSIWAKECCDTIKEAIDDLFYYADNEMVWQLPQKYAKKLNQKIISPDLFYRGKIIEFHGDVFHGNPDLFEDNETIHPFNKQITVSQLREIDNIRTEYYISKGYTVLEVWENDYKTNSTGVINKCLTFLK